VALIRHVKQSFLKSWLFTKSTVFCGLLGNRQRRWSRKHQNHDANFVIHLAIYGLTKSPALPNSPAT